MLRALSLIALAGVCSACSSLPPAPAAPDAVERGRTFVQRACAGCHAIEAYDEGLNAHAPPFRDLARRRTDAELSTTLGEISRSGHVEMPPIYITPEEMRDVVAYMRSLTGRAT